VGADEDGTRAAGPEEDRREQVRERFSDPGRRLHGEQAAPVKRLGPKRRHLALPLSMLEAGIETLEARKGLV
jgi:hypothetical protein